MTEAAAALAYWKANHCQSARVIPRGGEQDYRYEVAGHIATLEPTSILEFGCSSGRNLACLRELLPSAVLAGIDPNRQAVEAGRAAHPSIIYVSGDDGLLRQQPDASFDVVLSVSVLDHIPSPEWRAVYDQLVRVARVAVVLLEPMYGPDIGKLVESRHWLEADFRDVGVAAPSFTYAHDYLGHDPLLRTVRRLPVQGLAQWAEFGSLYYLLERQK